MFKPERWLKGDPDEETLTKMFIPFTSGKRNCIGQNLAMLELKLVLANILRSFEFELVSDVKSEYYLTLKPANAFLRVSKLF